VTPGPYGETEADLDEVPDWVNGPAAPEPDPGPPPAPPPLEPGEASALSAPPLTERPARSPRSRAAARRGQHRPAGRRSPWPRRILIAAGGMVIVLLAVALGTFLWVDGHLKGAGGAEVDVTIPNEAGHAVLASTLTKAGVVSDAWLFRHYLDYRNEPPVAGGNYAFHHHEGYREALTDIGRGPKPVETRLTIPEGFDLAQTAAAVGQLPGLSAARFLQLAQSGAVRSPFEPAGVNDLEGLIFPDTYFVDSTEDEQEILQTMVDRFDDIAAQVGLSNSEAAIGLTPYQTVILASLVEKEAKVPQDRGKIARVVLNRLRDGMKLQIDATVEYAEGVHKDRLLYSDLKVNSPYNTYIINGLPPGPIAAPGEASLEAALNPTPGSWLYYVVIDSAGDSGFATTPAEFDQLVAEARARGVA